MTIEESFNLARQLSQNGQPQQAESIYRHILAQRPDFPQAHYQLANALKSQGKLPEAVAAYHQAIAQSPGFAQAYNNLGNTLRTMGASAQALEALRQAVTLSPQDGVMQYNYGNALIDAEQIDSALDAFSRAVVRRPDLVGAHFNLGTLLLLKGNYPAGWPEFEWRWQMPILAPLKITGQHPDWDGSPLNGKRILVYADQSLGDTLNFIRYVPLIIDRGGKIILACHPELHRLFSSIAPIDQWISDGDPLPDYDVQCPMMSLPRIFNTELDNIPSKVPYLRPDPALSQKWRDRIPNDARKKIGLVWAGTPNPLGRSIPAESLAPLAAIPDLWFCSLQKWAHRMEDVKRDSPPLPMVDWTGELTDFADTAALMDNLDLIITIDTAAAHLAGALGKKTWVLLKTFPDWRWLLDRTDSPWYPTLRLFRQKRPGDWTDPVAAMVQALQTL